MNARRDGGAGLGISWLLIYFTLVHFSFLTFWVRKWGLTISVLGWILNIWRKTRNNRGRNQLSVHTADVLVYILSNQMCSSNLPFLSSMNDLTKLSIQSTSLGPQYFICVAVSELPLSFPCTLLTQKKLKWDLHLHSLKIRFLKYIPPTDLTKSDYTSRSCFWEEVEAKIEGEFVIDREQLTHVLTAHSQLQAAQHPNQLFQHVDNTGVTFRSSSTFWKILGETSNKSCQLG